MLSRFIPMRGSYVVRAIDRFVGIPLLFFLGLFTTEKERGTQEPKTIAVLMSVAIGDSVLFMSVVRDLLRKFPRTKITLFCGESNREFLSRYENVDLISLKIMNPFFSIMKIRASGSFDVWIDTGQWQRISALYTFFARAAWKMGFRTRGQGRHFVYDEAVPHMSTVHELENYRNLARKLGCMEFTPPEIIGKFPPEKNRVVLHAFAGGSKPYLKEWPDAYWVELINELLKQGKNIFLTGTRGDAVRAQGIANHTKNPFAVQVLAGKLSLNETIDELSKAEWVVSVNTGIMHLAAALGAKTIGLHGPTSVKRWGPVGRQVFPIQSTLHCSPCLNLGFDYGCPRNDCMKEISSSQIAQLLSE